MGDANVIILSIQNEKISDSFKPPYLNMALTISGPFLNSKQKRGSLFGAVSPAGGDL